MRRVNLIFVFILFSKMLYSQNCNEIIRSFDGKICYPKTGEKNYDTYQLMIKDFYKNDKSLISKRSEVENVNLLYQGSNNIYFGDGKKILLYILTKIDTVLYDTLFKETEIEELDKVIFFSKQFNHKQYGNFKEVDNNLIYRKITDIGLCYKNKNLKIPDSLFVGFLNPKITNNYFGLRTIEFFKNKSKDIYYIYIMGELPKTLNEEENIDISKASYILKIIIDPNRNTYNRLIIKSKDLIKYCWPNITNFWPF